MLVSLAVVVVGVLSGWVRRYHGLASAQVEPVSQFPGVIGAISEKLAGPRGTLQQRAGTDQVMGVARGERESDGPAQRVCQGVNFR